MMTETTVARDSARKSFVSKFDKRWLGMSLVAAGAATAADQAEAAIISFAPAGGVNSPATISGVYVNLETGASSASGSGFTDATKPILNLWGTSGLHVYFYPASPATTVNRVVSTTPAGSTMAVLTTSDTVGSTSNYASARGLFTPGTTSTWGNPAGFTGYFGFKFQPAAGGGPYYGWANLTVKPYTSGTTYAGAVLNSWAYDDSGAPIPVGAVPEPTALATLAAGAAGILWRRRQSAA